MPLEFAIAHSLSDVQSAVMQFTARRGLRMSQPGHIDGLCIENAALSTPARVEVHICATPNSSTISLMFGENSESVQLAYALRCYLADEQAYTCECPPICPKCNVTVANVTAKYCACCGSALIATMHDERAPTSESNKLTIAD